MKILSTKTFIVGLVALLAVVAVQVSRTPSLHTEGIVRYAVDAYIYGYPLVTFDMARKQQTNVEVPDEQHAPMNQMIKMRTYLPIDNHCCAAPNADTLYTIAWLDVTEEPWLLSVPEIRDRYYIVPLLDGFSEVIKVVSSINDGAEAQTLAITGPGWSGTLPVGVTEVKSSTAIVWMLGRIYSTGTPEDYKIVNDIQDQFEVVPLSAYGKSEDFGLTGDEPLKRAAILAMRDAAALTIMNLDKSTAISSLCPAHEAAQVVTESS